MTTGMNLSFIIDNLGPYHIARLSAISRLANVRAIEVHGNSVEYAWSRAGTVPFRRDTLIASEPYGAPWLLVQHALDTEPPNVIFTSGWSSSADLAALAWAGRNRVPAIVMSASQAIDFPRNAHVEWVKRRILAHVSGALVGGTPHADYARALGIPSSMIRTGYDVVDNAHFAVLPNRTRRGFIASARFIAKKNLPFLLRAHAAYRAMHLAVVPSETPWDLTLLGDGSQRAELEAQAERQGGGVLFKGFLQYPDLPAAFAAAGVFVHTSTTEQWGLVVNEAMAAGLPVLVSDRCGCVPDLIEEGVNGHALKPADEAAWARAMLKIARMPEAERAAMGAASQRIIAGYTPETHAAAAVDIARAALTQAPRRIRSLDALLLAAVGRRRQ